METEIIKNKKRGFALLFSVLVSSLLLTIGLSIFNIALKELAISTATRQSIHAFYAADSGRGYALYNDLKVSGFFFSSQQLSGLNDGPAGGSLEYPNPPSDNTTLVFDADGPNYRIEIKKVRNKQSEGGGCSGDLEKVFCTTITAYGYDSDSGDKLERAIQQTY